MNIYTRHRSGESTLSFLGDDSSPERGAKKKSKHNSSLSECPLVRPLLDQLHVPSSRTKSASKARTAGQQLLCASVQDQVWVDHSHSLARVAPGGGKKHRNLTLLNASRREGFIFYFIFLAETGGRLCGTGKAEQTTRAGNQEARRGPQSSVVSQLTSRGTWRHLVPVWMTVTVEGRGRASSSTTATSSSTEGAPESRGCPLTPEGKGVTG